MKKVYISVNSGPIRQIKRSNGLPLICGDITNGEVVKVYPEELLLTTIDRDFKKWFDCNPARKGAKAKGELLAWIKNLTDIAYRKGLNDAK